VGFVLPVANAQERFLGKLTPRPKAQAFSSGWFFIGGAAKLLLVGKFQNNVITQAPGKNGTWMACKWCDKEMCGSFSLFGTWKLWGNSI